MLAPEANSLIIVAVQVGVFAGSGAMASVRSDRPTKHEVRLRESVVRNCDQQCTRHEPGPYTACIGYRSSSDKTHLYMSQLTCEPAMMLENIMLQMSWDLNATNGSAKNLVASSIAWICEKSQSPWWRRQPVLRNLQIIKVKMMSAIDNSFGGFVDSQE